MFIRYKLIIYTMLIKLNVELISKQHKVQVRMLLVCSSETLNWTCKITKVNTINPEGKMNIWNFPVVTEKFHSKPQIQTSWWITGKSTGSLMSLGPIIWDLGMCWRRFIPSYQTIMEQSGPSPTQVDNGEVISEAEDFYNGTERELKQTGHKARIPQPLQF